MSILETDFGESVKLSKKLRKVNERGPGPGHVIGDFLFYVCVVVVVVVFSSELFWIITRHD